MNPKPKKTTKPKPKARERTSARVSSAAGRLMEMLGRGYSFMCHPDIGGHRLPFSNDVTRLVKMVAASAMGQREGKP